jgi:hypothetical protein
VVRHARVVLQQHIYDWYLVCPAPLGFAASEDAVVVNIKSLFYTCTSEFQPAIIQQLEEEDIARLARHAEAKALYQVGTSSRSHMGWYMQSGAGGVHDCCSSTYTTCFLLVTSQVALDAARKTQQVVTLGEPPARLSGCNRMAANRHRLGAAWV